MPIQKVHVPLFIGGTDHLFTRQANPERCVNLFPETIKRGSKAEKYLRPTEGLIPFAQIPGTLDTSEMLYQDGRLFVCCGSKFAEVFDNGSVVIRGDIASDGTKATMATSGSSGTVDPPILESGHQIVICSGGGAWCFDTNTNAFTFLSVPSAFTLDMVEYVDGYFLLLARNRRYFFWSTRLNGLTWNTSTQFIGRTWGGDNISFLKRQGRQLWLVGTQTSEVWADTGVSNIPFGPIQGAFLDIGCVARFTGLRDGESLCWLSQSTHSGGALVRANGYTPDAISTYSIDSIVQSLPTLGGLNSARAFMHGTGGHRFLWLQVGGLPTTLVFDFTEQQWHERAMWDYAKAEWTRHIARSHAWAYESHYVGVANSNVIYRMDFDYVTDGLV